MELDENSKGIKTKTHRHRQRYGDYRRESGMEGEVEEDTIGDGGRPGVVST